MRNKLSPLSQIMLFAVVLVAGLGLLMNYLLGKPAREYVLDNSLKQQLVVTRASGAGIEFGLDRIGRALEQMADMVSVSDDKKTRDELRLALEHWKDTAWMGIGLLNSDGKLLMVVNLEDERGGEGMNLGEREYFKKVIEGDGTRYVVGESVLSLAGATKGEYIVPIAAPIFENGKKSGVLIASVLVSSLTEEYFRKIELIPETDVFLIRKDGAVLYSSVEEMTGKNNMALLAEAQKSGVNLDEGGSKQMVLPNFRETGFADSYLVSLAPVKLGESSDFVLAVATPSKHILRSMGPIYARQVLVVIVAFMAMMVFAIRVAKSLGYYEGKKDSD